MADAQQDADEQPREIPEKFSRAEAVASVFRAAFKWGGLVAIAFFFSVESLAGQTTVADLGLTIRAFASVRLSEILAWAVATSGVGYGLSQRGLRRRTIERLEGRIHLLEKGVDPDRTSSGLTPRGETHPEDL